MRRVSSVLAVACGAVLMAVVLVAPAVAAEYMPFEPNSLPAGTFESPGTCTCHGDLVEQWSSTMHSKAWTDPIYQHQLEAATADMGEGATTFCVGCHAPAGLSTGTMEGAELDAATNGITCAFCHYTVGITEDPPGNLSIGFPLGGPDGMRRAQIMDPKAPHGAQGSEFFDSAELCGACHNVNHPVNGMHLEMTYTEWAESPQAELGITCQNCHMHKEVGGSAPFTGQAAAGAPERDNIFAMTFVGPNVAQGNPELATALLQRAATIAVTVPEIVAPGETVTAEVAVTNEGAGHSIPTGLTEVRRMRLEVYSVAADGTEAELANTEFRTIVRDKDGNEGGTDFWNAEEKVSDLRIKAGETYTETVEFEMPAGADSQKLFAVLRYQSTDDEMAAAAGVENPTTDMASAEVVVYSSAEARDAAPAEEPDGAAVDPMLIAAAVALVLLAGGGLAYWLSRRRNS